MALFSRFQILAGRVLVSGTPERFALTAFSIRIVSAAIAFLSQIVLARLMGGFDYGVFTFVWVLVIIVGTLSGFGFPTTIIRFLPQYRADGQFGHIRGLTLAAPLLAMGIASLLALLGWFAIQHISAHIEAYMLVPLTIGLMILPMIALGDMMDGIARASGWPIIALSPTYIVRPLAILAFMMMAAALGYDHSARVALTAALLATYITSIAQCLLVMKRLLAQVPREPRALDFAKWLPVALPILVIELFGFLLTNSDVVMVGFFLRPEDVAIYFAAAKVIALVNFVIFAVKAAAGPRFANAIAAGNSTQLSQIAVESARWTFFPSLALGVVLLLAGPWLLALFGTGFVAGHSLMLVLFIGIACKAFVGPAETLLMMAGEQKLCVGIYGGAVMFSIIVNVIFIPLFGTVGAALSTMSAMIVETVMLHVAVRCRFGLVLTAFSNVAEPNSAFEREKW